MKRLRGIFITGTDTGVGKTYVAAGIASALRRTGVDVGVMKPAETGCPVRAGRLIPRDALRLMRAAGVKDDLDLVNPCRFRKPLAPAIAAELEGGEIDIEKIRTAFRKLSSRHNFMIIEGAGGIMAPLSGAFTFLDLAKAFGLPVLVVARPGLGTVNHTLLTIAALKSKGLTLAGIIINHAKKGNAGEAEKTNPAVISSLCNRETPEIIRYGSTNFNAVLERLK
jgi:dethiobiotin synthetase